MRSPFFGLIVGFLKEGNQLWEHRYYPNTAALVVLRLASAHDKAPTRDVYIRPS